MSFKWEEEESNYIKGVIHKSENTLGNNQTIIIKEQSTGILYEVLSRLPYKSIDIGSIVVHKSEIIGVWKDEKKK